MRCSYTISRARMILTSCLNTCHASDVSGPVNCPVNPLSLTTAALHGASPKKATKLSKTGWLCLPGLPLRVIVAIPLKPADCTAMKASSMMAGAVTICNAEVRTTENRDFLRKDPRHSLPAMHSNDLNVRLGWRWSLRIIHAECQGNMCCNATTLQTNQVTSTALMSTYLNMGF